MARAPLADNETERLAALQSCQILDTPPDPAYDDITKLLAYICQTPITLVSLIDEERQWFKSRYGLDAEQTHRDLAFCAHAILEPSRPLIVEDASQDPRFCYNDLVRKEPHIRFYAGYPLVTEAGYPLGTLCAIDTVPRTLSETQMDALNVLARNVSCLLNARFYQERLEKEVEERTMQLALARDEATAANAMKSEFLANISHELRTPLHAVMSYSRIGRDRAHTWDSARHGENLSRIHEQSNRLLRLVNNLLDLAKMETEQSDLHCRYQDMEALAKTICSEMELIAQAKTISLTVVPPQEPLPAVYCDEAKIHQVLANLVANAIKFTHPDTQVTIELAAENVDSDSEQQWAGISREWLRISVTDQGVGIPEGEVDDIFHKFVQSSRTNTGAGGTGLGLAICQEIIDAHAGHIRAENNDHGGACFHIMLPLSPNVTDLTTHVKR